MPHSAEECNAILAAFDSQFHLVYADHRVVRIDARVDDKDRPQLVVVFRTGTPERRRLLASLVESDHAVVVYEYEGRPLEAEVVSDEDSLAILQVKPGSSAWGAGSDSSGTVGWNLILDYQLVCLSNNHIFCPAGNATPIGSLVTLNRNTFASLAFFEPVPSSAGVNVWDLAIATYHLPAHAEDHMRHCEDGLEFPYPQTFASSVSVNDGERYRKVGNRPPICRSGARLSSISKVKVDYGGAVGVVWFTSQLVFEKMTDPGDSGCIITRESDNAVVGLNFAGSDRVSVSNPLYTIGWARLGAVAFDTGVTLPLFDSRGAVRWGNSGFRLPERPVEDERDLPDMVSGLRFLGLVYVKGKHPGGRPHGESYPEVCTPEDLLHTVAGFGTWGDTITGIPLGNRRICIYSYSNFWGGACPRRYMVFGEGPLPPPPPPM